MIETLEDAAEIIEFEERYRKSADRTLYRKVAKRLRKIAEYHKPNPLGGPARVFDFMADMIRAGEDYNFILTEYGFKVDKEKK